MISITDQNVLKYKSQNVNYSKSYSHDEYVRMYDRMP